MRMAVMLRSLLCPERSLAIRIPFVLKRAGGAG